MFKFRKGKSESRRNVMIIKNTVLLDTMRKKDNYLLSLRTTYRIHQPSSVATKESRCN